MGNIQYNEWYLSDKTYQTRHFSQRFRKMLKWEKRREERVIQDYREDDTKLHKSTVKMVLRSITLEDTDEEIDEKLSRIHDLEHPRNIEYIL